MLGEIGADLREALGIDVVELPKPTNMFGFKNAGWKPWRTFDGTDVLVPADFNTDPEPSGEILMYPQGDRSAKPSARMPKGGFYFDSIIRQPPIDDAKLNPADNLEEFAPSVTRTSRSGRSTRPISMTTPTWLSPLASRAPHSVTSPWCPLRG